MSVLHQPDLYLAARLQPIWLNYTDRNGLYRHKLSGAHHRHHDHAKNPRHAARDRSHDPSRTALGSGRQRNSALLQQKRHELLAGNVQHGHHRPILRNLIPNYPIIPNQIGDLWGEEKAGNYVAGFFYCSSVHDAWTPEFSSVTLAEICRPASTLIRTISL